MATNASYVARHFALELDGLPCGYLRSVEGGGTKAEIVSQQVGGTVIRGKHIAGPTPEPITAVVGMSMSKPFWQWIEDSWNGTITRHNGSVIALDRNLNVVHEQSFLQALVVETSFPALDASSKEPGYITVKFLAESSEHKPGDGRKARAEYASDQKLWLPANFRLEIEGLDCSKVSKIDAITVKQNTKRVEIGPKREYELEPSSLEYPNVSVTMSMASAESWFAWHKDFVVAGNNLPDKEKHGSITMLSPSRADELLEIELLGVGISNISPEKGASDSDAIRRVKAELYVEEMKLNYMG